MIASLAAALGLLYKIQDYSDLTFACWQLTVCALLAQAASIVTISMIYLKAILMALSSGMVTDYDIRRNTENLECIPHSHSHS